MDANGIREAREAAGMSPTELAFHMGMSQSSAWRYENGKQTVTLEVARRFAAVLETTVDELFPHEEIAA